MQMLKCKNQNGKSKIKKNGLPKKLKGKGFIFYLHVLDIGSNESSTKK